MHGDDAVSDGNCISGFGMRSDSCRFRRIVNELRRESVGLCGVDDCCSVFRSLDSDCRFAGGAPASDDFECRIAENG